MVLLLMLGVGVFVATDSLGQTAISVPGLTSPLPASDSGSGSDRSSSSSKEDEEDDDDEEEDDEEEEDDDDDSGNSGSGSKDDDDDDDHDRRYKGSDSSRRSYYYQRDSSSGSSSPTPTPASSVTAVTSVEEVLSRPVTPEVEIDVNGNQRSLSGERRVTVEVEHAERVDVVLVRSGSHVEYFIGTARRHNDDDWRLDWDTRGTPNGSYQLRAVVRNDFGTYTSAGPTVVVSNEFAGATQDISPTAELPKDIQEDIEESLAELEEELAEVSGQEPVTLGTDIDADGDGLPNSAEEQLGTDPNNPDSDGDGYIDGLEVARGYNPLVASPGDKIIFTQPVDDVGEVKETVYSVANVTVAEEEGQEVTVITGRARPLTFVTLYVYSDPIVVTVRTDEFGNFNYRLKSTLPDGEHRVYVALADSNGIIVEKSQPLAFVKTAQAITIDEQSVQASASTPGSPLEPRTIIMLTLVVVGIAIVVVIAVMVYVLRQTKQTPPPAPPAV